MVADSQTFASLKTQLYGKMGRFAEGLQRAIMMHWGPAALQWVHIAVPAMSLRVSSGNASGVSMPRTAGSDYCH